jgi:MFS family permease
LLLVILRMAQGFAIGGEWSGAVVVATENAPAGQRGTFGTFPQLGAPFGFILVNGVFLALGTWLPSDVQAAPRMRSCNGAGACPSCWLGCWR